MASELEQFLTGSSTGERLLTVIAFVDIVESTSTLSTSGERDWHTTLDRLDRIIDSTTERYGGTHVKNLGDGALSHFQTPSDALRFARYVLEEAHGLGLELRIGLHAGEVERRPNGDLAGLNVHVAARTQSAAEPGQVLVTGTVRDLLTGSGHHFHDAGPHQMKGLDRPWQLFTWDRHPSTT